MWRRLFDALYADSKPGKQERERDKGMTIKLTSILEQYPQLGNLRGKVPDEVIEHEAEPKIEQFEHYRPLAQQLIPASRLCDIFPSELEPISEKSLERDCGRLPLFNLPINRSQAFTLG